MNGPGNKPEDFEEASNVDSSMVSNGGRISRVGRVTKTTGSSPILPGRPLFPPQGLRTPSGEALSSAQQSIARGGPPTPVMLPNQRPVSGAQQQSIARGGPPTPVIFPNQRSVSGLLQGQTPPPPPFGSLDTAEGVAFSRDPYVDTSGQGDLLRLERKAGWIRYFVAAVGAAVAVWAILRAPDTLSLMLWPALVLAAAITTLARQWMPMRHMGLLASRVVLAVLCGLLVLLPMFFETSLQAGLQRFAQACAALINLIAGESVCGPTTGRWRSTCLVQLGMLSAGLSLLSLMLVRDLRHVKPLSLIELGQVHWRLATAALGRSLIAGSVAVIAAAVAAVGGVEGWAFWMCVAGILSLACPWGGAISALLCGAVLASQDGPFNIPSLICCAVLFASTALLELRLPWLLGKINFLKNGWVPQTLSSHTPILESSAALRMGAHTLSLSLLLLTLTGIGLVVWRLVVLGLNPYGWPADLRKAAGELRADPKAFVELMHAQSRQEGLSRSQVWPLALAQALSADCKAAVATLEGSTSAKIDSLPCPPGPWQTIDRGLLSLVELVQPEAPSEQQLLRLASELALQQVKFDSIAPLQQALQRIKTPEAALRRLDLAVMGGCPLPELQSLAAQAAAHKELEPGWRPLLAFFALLTERSQAVAARPELKALPQGQPLTEVHARLLKWLRLQTQEEIPAT